MTDVPIFRAKPNELYRIHTSDRLTYRKCRRLFVFSANVDGALGMEPIAWNRHLWLGTGVHKALELWYRHVDFPRPVPATPEGYEDGFLGEAPTQFVDTPAARFKDWRDWWEALPHIKKMMLAWDEDTRAEYKNFCNLGHSMLTHYYDYANEADNDGRRGFDIVETEVKFSVPIRDERGEPVFVLRPCAWGSAVKSDDACPDHGVKRPHLINTPAVYEGRFDGIVRDRTGRYWVLEHKTFKVYDERKMFNDDQSGSYLWAAQRIYGYKFAGVLYNVLMKKIPLVPPKVYVGKKNEGLSRDVRNVLKSTTSKLYRRAIADNDYEESHYSDELSLLDEWGWTNFFKRTWTERNAHEIEEVGLRILYETLEMANPETKMYPNPDGMRCPWCPFRVPCLMVSSGDDWREVLDENYRRRESTDVDLLDTEYMPE
jgi:hypothetical protein